MSEFRLGEFKENYSINDKLPGHVLLIIFNNLSITEKFKIRSVCKNWERLIDHLLNIQNDLVIEAKGDELLTVNNFKKISQLDYIYYDFIFYESEKRIFNKMVKQLLSKCTNLKTFCIKTLEPIDLTEFCCQKLENLILRNYNFHDWSDIILSIVSKCGNNLKYVEIDGDFSFDCLKFLIKNTPNLEAFALTIEKNYPLEDCLSYFHNKLEQFFLECRTENKGDIINSLCRLRCKNLKRFHFGCRPKNVNAEELQMVCEKFVCLTDFYCCVSDEDDVETITNLHNLEKIRLDLHWNFEYGDDSLNEVLKSCRKLKQIDIRGARLSNNSVKNIDRYCPSIEISKFSYCISLTGMTDEGLNEISKLSNLKELSIEGASITDDGLIKLMSKCHLIEKLDIKFCRKITDKFCDFCIELAKTRPTKSLEIKACCSQIKIDTDIELPKNLRFYP